MAKKRIKISGQERLRRSLLMQAIGKTGIGGKAASSRLSKEELTERAKNAAAASIEKTRKAGPEKKRAKASKAASTSRRKKITENAKLLEMKKIDMPANKAAKILQSNLNDRDLAIFMKNTKRQYELRGVWGVLEEAAIDGVKRAVAREHINDDVSRKIIKNSVTLAACLHLEKMRPLTNKNTIQILKNNMTRDERIRIAIESARKKYAPIIKDKTLRGIINSAAANAVRIWAQEGNTLHLHEIVEEAVRRDLKHYVKKRRNRN